MGITKFRAKGHVTKLVREFIELDAQQKELDKRRKELNEELMPVIEIAGPLAWGDKEIQKAKSSKKTPTKAELLEAFGPKGEAFWNTLRPHEYEYLSVQLKKL